MDLGQRLKDARTKAGMTQEDLAKQLGVSRQTVSNWENGRSTPDVGSVVSLGKLYHVSLDALLSGQEVIQQFEDMAQRRRKFWQMMLETGVIMQLMAKLLRGLDFAALGNVLTWAGFLLLTVSIVMHLYVFHHSHGEILRGLAGLTGWWTLVLGVWLVYGDAVAGDIPTLVVTGLNAATLLLIWSAGVWTIDWKSTRLWLIIVLWVGTPLLLSGMLLKDSGHLEESSPFLRDYRVEEVLAGEEGHYALVELSDNSMILSMDGVNRDYIGRFEYAEPTIADSEKGIWLLAPEDDPEALYKVTVEADDAVCLSYAFQGQLQWKWKLKPDHLKASLFIDTYGHSSSRGLTWYPDEIPDLEDPAPYFKSTDVVQWGNLTIRVSGSNGKTLELQEEYHHENGIDYTTFPLVPDEKGVYKLKLEPRYGGEKQQYAVYRIPFENGEFRFTLTHQGF